VLLAVIAGAYAVYHGPEGLTAIAARVHRSAQALAGWLRAGGVPLVLAGPVGGLPDAAALDAALADPGHPAHGNADVDWFHID